MGMVELALIGKLKKTKANIESPVLTGTPHAPTPTIGDSSTKIATTEFVSNTILNSDLVWNDNSHPSTLIEYGIIDCYDDSEVDGFLALKADVTYVDQKISDIIDSAPSALNTLNELATALNDDSNFASTVTNSLTSINTELDSKADQSTTYTKIEVDNAISTATPTFSSLTGKPTDIYGYGITDAYTKTEIDAFLLNAAGVKYYAQETAPISVDPGDIWFNQTNGKTYIRHIDINDTEIWMDINGGSTGVSAPTLKESDLIQVQYTNNSTYNFVYLPQFIQVFVNRLKLRKSEFTATNGTSITINIPLELNDEIEFITVETI